MASTTKINNEIDKEIKYLHNRHLSFQTPQCLKTEHEELHSDLKEIIKLGGDIGVSAEKIADLLHPHFLKEEEYGTPPLGLLTSLANGMLNSDMEDSLIMTRKLKQDLPEMKEEHKKIVNALKDLMIIARKNNNDEVQKFANKLIYHAQNEEEILYPAAILVGEYLKLRLFK